MDLCSTAAETAETGGLLEIRMDRAALHFRADAVEGLRTGRCRQRNPWYGPAWLVTAKVWTDSTKGNARRAKPRSRRAFRAEGVSGPRHSTHGDAARYRFRPWPCGLRRAPR